MAIKLDDELLASLGLEALRPATKRGMLQFIYQTLELRVGTTLANMMSDEQLTEFEVFIDAEETGEYGRDAALAWLEKNLPVYKEVVQETFTKLKAEITQDAPAILAAENSTHPTSNRNAMGGAA